MPRWCRDVVKTLFKCLYVLGIFVFYCTAPLHCCDYVRVISLHRLHVFLTRDVETFGIWAKTTSITNEFLKKFIGIATITIFGIRNNWGNFFKRHYSFTIWMFRRSFLSLDRRIKFNMPLAKILEIVKFFVGINFPSVKSDKCFIRWQKSKPTKIITDKVLPIRCVFGKGGVRCWTKATTFLK